MNKELLVTLSTGFALFSMFFGSGNLVFPIRVGLESEGHYVLASLGVLCTCVLFPLLGMLGMTLYKGDTDKFFACFGKTGTFLFSLLALSLMGPFGVLARCLTVMHGALVLLFPALKLEVASMLLCIVIYFLTINKNKIVTLLGAYLTPFLLVAIALIVFFGLQHASLSVTLNDQYLPAFTNGFFTGYQTMDLVASFFFSGFVMQHLHRANLGKDSHVRLFVKASLVGALLLYAVYFALVLLGWLYAPLLADTAPQELFGKIAFSALGTFAAPAVCLVVVLACLTTAIALTSLFADFLRRDVCKDAISNKLALGLTLGVAFAVSNLAFSGIANFLGPILETVYPALITLTVANIACKLCSIKASHWPFTTTVVTKLLWV